MSRELQVIAPRGVARSFDPVALVDDWHADMAQRVAAGELAATTAQTYTRGMLAFLRWHEDNAPAPRVGPGALRGWKADMLARGRKPAGVNVRLAGVRAFFVGRVPSAAWPMTRPRGCLAPHHAARADATSAMP